MVQRTRLGLDLGTNSIGWCLLKLDDSGRPTGMTDAGVRLLTVNDEAGRDPQSKQSLAADRRAARAQRRRRDRFLMRQKRLMATLIEAGLMPQDEAARKALEALDPYYLRAEALDRRLDLHEIGRAIFHLNQRRGFKSNRIADANDSEEGAIKAGMAELQDKLDASAARTLGEFLARRHGRDREGYRLNETGRRAKGQHAAPEPVRFRPTRQGAKNLYELGYPSRDMIEHELDAIWSAQAEHHGDLTPALLQRLKRIIIEQRPLKAPVVGRCTLFPEEDKVEIADFEIDLGERAPKAHPLFQRFRILADIGNLVVNEPSKPPRNLTSAEARAMTNTLMSASGNAVPFETLRKKAKLPEQARLNQELAGRKGYPPDLTAAKLAMKKMFGPMWRQLPLERQIEVVERLLHEEEPKPLIEWLLEHFDLAPERAEAIAAARLPQGHAQFGRRALNELVEALEADEVPDPQTGEVHAFPRTYDRAVAALGEHHSDLRPKSREARLPYYGAALKRHVISKPDAAPGSQEHIGRVPNPTVHIGLNQVRAVVNALIDVHGPIDEIAIELARELKLNAQRKEEIKRENRENEAKNDARRETLAKLGVADTHRNRLMLRLFDELPADEKVCVYTGEPLSIERLFSGGVDIDHILPHSATLDDSFSNKVLCTAPSNREKGNRAPEQAWRSERLAEIEARARRLFPRKAWRFSEGAIERFSSEGGFLARQLTDTQHMARLARTYLEHVCDQVWAPPGRLTAMLRAKWGLNDLLPDHNFEDTGPQKNRKDHRHHAIDAFVVACTDRGLLNRIARESGKAEDLNLDHLFPKDSFPIPYDGFRDELQTVANRIIVSHKPDHGLAPGAQDDVRVTSGQLHEETAYGLVDEEIDGKAYNLVTRKPVTALTAKEIDRVRDARLREQLQTLAYEAKRDGRKLEDALAEFADTRNVRRVRILKTEQSVRTVRHGAGFSKAYVPGDNHRVEIFVCAGGKWRGEGITVFDANQPRSKPTWRRSYPDAELVMRVHKGDLIEADFGEGKNVFRVYQLEASNNRLRLVAHNEAGSIQERHKDPDDPLRWIIASYSTLRKAGARRVTVDPIGRVRPARDTS